MNASVESRVEAIVRVQGLALRKAGPLLASSGVPVFPCVDGGKVPRSAHGLLDATADGRNAERWWSRWPNANIGLPTGPVSGFDVVDVDVRESGSGYEVFHRAVAHLGIDRWAIRVLTPSGGMHVYYPADPGRAQRSWVSAKAHVDFRGAGGAVILPPSIGVCGHDVPQPYTLVKVRQDARPIDAEALRDFVDPEWARRRFATRLRKLPQPQARESALRAWVASRREGERNTGLFWAACRMAEAGHPLDATMESLTGPAQDCGLLDREIQATIRSAYRHTMPSPVVDARREPPRPFSPDQRSVLTL